MKPRTVQDVTGRLCESLIMLQTKRLNAEFSGITISVCRNFTRLVELSAPNEE